jgi:hypothetical protein
LKYLLVIRITTWMNCLFSYQEPLSLALNVSRLNFQ